MTKTVKQIKKIKLNDDGLKGAEVTYIHPQEKDNMIWSNEHTEKRKHPIHGELEASINDLRNFLLEICGYYPVDIEVNTKNQMIADTRVTEIVMEPEKFKLSGEMRVIGDKFIKVSTPDIEIGDGYAHFDTVVKIIAKIVEEAHEYMAGKKRMSETDFLEKWAKRKGEEGLIKELKHMSAKEKRDYYTTALEKMGAIVIMDESAEISEDSAQMEITNVEVEEIEAEVIPITTPVSEAVQEEIPVAPIFNAVPPKMPAF